MNDEIRQLLAKYSDPVRPPVVFEEAKRPTVLGNVLTPEDKLEFGLADIEKRLQKGATMTSKLDDSGEFQPLDDIFGKADGLEDVLYKFDSEEVSEPLETKDNLIHKLDRKPEIKQDSSDYSSKKEMINHQDYSQHRPDRHSNQLDEKILTISTKNDHDVKSYLYEQTGCWQRHDDKPIKASLENNFKAQQPTSMTQQPSNLYNARLLHEEEDLFSKDDASFLEKMKEVVRSTKRDIDSLFGPEDPAYQRLTGQSFNPRPDLSMISALDKAPKFNQADKLSSIEIKTSPSVMVLGSSASKLNQASPSYLASTAGEEEPLGLLQSMKAKNNGPVSMTLANKSPKMMEFQMQPSKPALTKLVQQNEEDEGVVLVQRPLPPNQVKQVGVSSSNSQGLTSYYDKIPSLRKKAQAGSKHLSQKARAQPTSNRPQPNFGEDDDDGGFCLKRHLAN